jgi:hypothetical protein
MRKKNEFATFRPKNGEKVKIEKRFLVKFRKVAQKKKKKRES